MKTPRDVHRQWERRSNRALRPLPGGNEGTAGLTHPDYSIPRRRGSEEDDFEALRSEGVRLISELSGDQWTDYNLHDPGITILEQLCYALTDLIYRARLPVEDHLTGEDGRIALEEQALHRPEVIFPSRPTTPGDHRRAILASVPEVEDVWLTPSTTHGRTAEDGWPIPTGIYRVRVRVTDTGRPLPDVLAEVRAVLLANRNLGEDVEANIAVATEEPCHLVGEIDIGGIRSPEEILSEIYLAVDRYVTSHMPDSEASSVTADQSLEEVFTGPYPGVAIRHITREADLDKIHIADIVSLIRGVDGVAGVRDVALIVGDTTYRESVDRRHGDVVRRLLVPRSPSETGRLRLVRGDRSVSVSSGFWYNYRQLSDAYRRRVHHLLKPEALYADPRGRNRDLAGYRSIQHDFPGVYGINGFGLPASATPRDRARAAQLKAYLLPLEQLMANYLASLSQVRSLFSTGDASRRTYAFSVLGDTEVPNVEHLYRADPGDFLAKVYRSVDDYAERKGRVLDHMLALFGESFDDSSFAHFDHHYGQERVGGALVRSKLAFLRRIVEVGRDRGSGFDYSQSSWSEAESRSDTTGTLQLSGLQHRVGLLLGFARPSNRSLVDALTEHGLRLVPHDRYQESMAGRPQLELVDIDHTYQVVPRRGTAAEINIDTLRRVVVPLRSNVISDVLFTQGLDRARYRLGKRGERHVLAFQPGDSEQWWYMGDYPTETGGWSAANALMRYLIDLNLDSEGFHVVEHVLLRPEGSAAAHRGATPGTSRDLWADFYPSRVSVLFCGWSARCRDPRFRRLAEETIRLNCPAHIHPECYWLDFEQMSDFEKKYRVWLDRKADGAEAAAARDDAAVPVIDALTALQDEAWGGAA